MRRFELLRSLTSVALLTLSLACLAATASGVSVFDSSSVWTSDRGETLRLAQWRGHTVVITMAYSSCGKVCVATMHKLEELQAAADRQGRSVEFVVVGYNPLLDTPSAWAAYRRSRRLERANWHFLTGTDEDTHDLARVLGIDYWLYDDHVMHDFKIVLLDDNGRPLRALAWDERRSDLF